MSFIDCITDPFQKKKKKRRLHPDEIICIQMDSSLGSFKLYIDWTSEGSWDNLDSFILSFLGSMALRLVWNRETAIKEVLKSLNQGSLLQNGDGDHLHLGTM